MAQEPSIAAQVIVTIIPIVAIAMGSVLIFFYLLWHHKEKMLMIEKGMIQRPTLDMDSFSLFYGLILFGVGTSLSLFFYIKEGVSYSILSGLIPLSTGVSLISFFIIRRLDHRRKND